MNGTQEVDLQISIINSFCNKNIINTLYKRDGRLVHIEILSNLHAKIMNSLAMMDK